MDGSVHMGLGRKVEHRTGLVRGQELRHQFTVANVTLHKHMARVVFERREVGQIACVSELVEVDEGLI